MNINFILGGSNFNAEAENNGQAVVTVGGTIHGFALNRCMYINKHIFTQLVAASICL